MNSAHGVPSSASADRAACPVHGGNYHWTQDCPACVKDAGDRGMDLDEYQSRVRPTLTRGVPDAGNTVDGTRNKGMK